MKSTLFLMVLFGLISSICFGNSETDSLDLGLNNRVDYEHLPVIRIDDLKSEFDSTLIEDKEFENSSFEKAYRGGVISGAKLRAISILTKAYQEVKSLNWRSIFNRVHGEVSYSTIHFPNVGYDFTGCKSATLAFAYVNGSDIYICSRSFTMSRDAIAQIIIHEGAHLEGYGNECDATRVEAYAMAYSGVGLQFKNGYYSSCNI